MPHGDPSSQAERHAIVDSHRRAFRELHDHGCFVISNPWRTSARRDTPSTWGFREIRFSDWVRGLTSPQDVSEEGRS